jgi:uncharacterized protein involved in exopolysaccharide biosynthesis
MAVTERELEHELPASPPASPGSVDALEILLVLTRRPRMIGVFITVGLLAGVALAFALKTNFTANATVLPPQQQSSSAALLNQLGSLANLGGANALGLKTPADMYVGMLESRTIADNLIAKFGLQAVYGRKTLQDTRLSLKKHTSIDVGKDGMIEIAVTDHDAKRASDLANGYIEQLDFLTGSLAIGEAAQRRLFFDRQLEGERKALAAAEEDLQTTQQKTGLIQMSGQAQVIIQSIAQLQADIAGREVQLQSVRSFATEQNPDVVRLRNEIAAMRAQLNKMEKDQPRDSQAGDIAIPSGSLPKDSLEYARRLRAVKYHESLFDLMSKQEEAARIDEAKSAPILQIVDHAIPPDKRSGPPRMLIIIGLAVIGWIVGCTVAVSEYMIHRLDQVPDQRAKLLALRAQLRRS